jgi:uncharacterized membrane protein
MLFSIDLVEIGYWIIYLIIPVFIVYIAYLIYKKAFMYMGFSSFEAIVIVFISLIFWRDIIIFGYNLSNIHLFYYNNWNLSINTGGAIIPIFLSVFLFIKKKLSIKKVLIGISVVTIVAFFVTKPVPSQGIVASFPYWLLPALFASIVSFSLIWKDFLKAAPLAYISGTIGVIIGADFLHLFELLNTPIKSVTRASIGGADVFDMIYITGILAVIIDGIIMFKQKSRSGIE